MASGCMSITFSTVGFIELPQSAIEPSARPAAMVESLKYCLSTTPLTAAMAPSSFIRLVCTEEYTNALATGVRTTVP